MADAKAKVGHGLAKVLGIKLDYRNPTSNRVTRGESVFSVASADSYNEDEPTSVEWIQSVVPSTPEILAYCRNLFPFTRWIGNYNLQWLMGDLVAGITIGAVVVPQSMAYAKLAELPVQFGLYSSFMGVLIYWFFATSKDITIGPVAVMSTVTGTVVLDVMAKIPTANPQDIAGSLAIVGGGIVCGLGLLRLGWLVDFISLASISAFMTGSAISIAAGQVPTMMGITIPSTRAPTYLVIINTLKGLPTTQLDAAMGLTALTMLYLIRSVFNFMGNKNPERRKLYFFLNTLRTVFVILLYTLISWLVNMHLPNHDSKKAAFKILGHVPRGFQDAKVPNVQSDVVSAFASQLPATVIVLLIEHISIAKSFGRINNYQIDPSQEMVAIGVTNLLGPFLGAYPSTGSFSRTAIKSKAGVRTPLAGVITSIVVLLAIYALPAVFFYIPSAALSAVIIHAVGDLITPPNTVYQFWRVSPLEVVIFFAGVIVTVFASIEDGIYTTVAVSAALLLFRVFKARGRFLGRVKVHSVIGDHLIENNDKTGTNKNGGDGDSSARDIFLPIGAEDGSNPLISPQHPYPGIFIYRFSEGYNYPNANHYLDYMVQTIFKETRRTNPNSYPRPGDRPWNFPGPKRGKDRLFEDDRPTLKAVILDFSSVNNVDITSVQHLIDVRNQLDRYAAPDNVQWHFACITNRWTKRALGSAGFGFPTPEGNDGFQRWKPIFSVAELGGHNSAAAAAEDAENLRRSYAVKDVEHGHVHTMSSSNGEEDEDEEDGGIVPADHDAPASIEKTLRQSKAYRTDPVDARGTKVAVVHGLNRPFFHIDLTSALQSAIHNSEALIGKTGESAS